MLKQDSQNRKEGPAGNSLGQGLVEYLILVSLLAIVIMLAVKNFGETTDNKFSGINSSLKVIDRR